MLIGGIVMLIRKPKRNWFVGYRLGIAMENEKNWQYANKIMSIIMTVFGAIMLAETLVMNLLKLI